MNNEFKYNVLGVFIILGIVASLSLAYFAIKVEPAKRQDQICAAAKDNRSALLNGFDELGDAFVVAARPESRARTRELADEFTRRLEKRLPPINC